MAKKIPVTYCKHKNCTYRLCKYHLYNCNVEKVNKLDLEGVVGCRRDGKNSKSYELTVLDDMKNQNKSIKKYTTKRVVNLNSGQIFNSVEDASRKCKISVSSIRKCCRGVTYSAGGCQWAYMESYGIDF